MKPNIFSSKQHSTFTFTFILINQRLVILCILIVIFTRDLLLIPILHSNSDNKNCSNIKNPHAPFPISYDRFPSYIATLESADPEQKVSLPLLETWFRSSRAIEKRNVQGGYSWKRRTSDSLLEGNTYYRFWNGAQVIPVQIMTNVHYRVRLACLRARTCVCVSGSAAPWKNFFQPFLFVSTARISRHLKTDS